MGRMLYTFLALLSLAGCNRAQDTLATTGPIQPAFLSADSLLVDSILGTLSMEEQVAQLLMVPIYARTDTTGWAEAERWTRDLGLGGVICMQGGPEHQRTRLKRLQEKARVPLMASVNTNPSNPISPRNKLSTISGDRVEGWASVLSRLGMSRWATMTAPMPWSKAWANGASSMESNRARG